MVKENPTEEAWNELKKVTDDFTAPADACPTYEKTYALLKELNKK